MSSTQGKNLHTLSISQIQFQVKLTQNSLGFSITSQYTRNSRCILPKKLLIFDTIGPPPHPKGATPEQTTPLKERKTPRVLYDNKVYIQNTKKNKNVKYTPSQTEL
eukprot:TRINITY_DN8261_c0_g2_i8.p2 TRINITY_DN8261_c0_g2~~TRINITY_DN8261_c0_g2_i8.p2  ORF type:complete len:106 (+),score=2.57 TRINITY_DN8261_c0_g2_i8:478-795(+)